MTVFGGKYPLLTASSFDFTSVYIGEECNLLLPADVNCAWSK